MARGKTFPIRFTEEEFALLNEYAQKDISTHTKKTKEKNISAYIRKCIFSSSRNPWELKKELKEMNYQIRKIGVNINQAVTKINSGYGSPSDIRMLQQCLADVENRVKGVEMQIEKNYGDNETHAHQFV